MSCTTVPVAFHKVNLVVLKDIHISANPPGRRRGSYCQEILDKLTWAGNLAHQVHGHVLSAGDMFHTKDYRSPNNSIAMLNALGDVLHGYPAGRLFGVVGNHDIMADNLETLPRQPLYNLEMADAFWNLSTNSVIFESEGAEGGAPIRVRVDGYNYEADARVIMEALQTAAPDPTCDYRVAVIHAFGCTGKSQPMYGEFAIGFDDLTTTPYDVFAWGHDHKPKGIIEVGKQRHLYLGSLSRAALTADELDRVVTVPVVSFSAEGIKTLELDVPVVPLEMAFHTAALEVERVDTRADVMEQKAATTAFMDDLQGHTEAIESEDPMEVLRSITTDTAIITEIQNACDLH